MMPHPSSQFKEKGHVPTNHNEKCFIAECKIMEQLQQLRGKGSQKERRSMEKWQEKHHENCNKDGEFHCTPNKRLWLLNDQLKKEISLLAQSKKKSHLEMVDSKTNQLKQVKATWKKRAEGKKKQHSLETHADSSENSSVQSVSNAIHALWLTISSSHRLVCKVAHNMLK